MSEGRRNDRDLSRPELEYAHRFAIERLSNENRTFWTRLSALLLGNSFLVAGFASLYGSKNPNDTLLLAIAAGGILIQAMWPLFALLSYSTNQYLIKLTMDIENYPYLTRHQFLKKEDIENRVRRIWTHYAKHFWSTFGSKRSQVEKSPNGENPHEHNSFFKKIKVWFKKYTEGFKKYPAGLMATLFFYGAFLAIWVVAAAIVHEVVAIVLGSLVFTFTILCILLWTRAKSAPIKSVR